MSPSCDGGGSPIITAIDSDRAAAGVAAVCANARLEGIARAWAATMAQSQTLGHQDLGGFLAGSGFHTMGENVFSGPSGMSAADVEAVWMGSAQHRAILLGGAFRFAGVGVATSPDGRMWIAVEFAG